MPKKVLKWWMRTPGACVKCPTCGKECYVQIQFGVDPKQTKAWKVTKKVVGKNEEAIGAGEEHQQSE